MIILKIMLIILLLSLIIPFLIICSVSICGIYTEWSEKKDGYDFK